MRNANDDVQQDAGLEPLPRPDALGAAPRGRPIDGHSAALFQPSTRHPGSSRFELLRPQISQPLLKPYRVFGWRYVCGRETGVRLDVSDAVLAPETVPAGRRMETES